MPFIRQSSILAALMLAVAALGAYHNSFGVPFVFDDDLVIFQNPSIRTLGASLFPPQEDVLGGLPISGRPVVNFSIALNYAISGTDVWTYHVFNLVLHVVNGWLLFGLLYRTLRTPKLAPQFGGHAFGAALLISAIWTLHPLQTESVTYISQRAEALAGLMYFLTLACYLRAAEPGARSLWGWGAFAACLLGMMTKEVMVSAPIFAALFDRAFLADSWRDVWSRRHKLLLALGSTWLLLGWIVVEGGGKRGMSAGFGLGVSWWSYLLKQAEAIVLYLKLSLWPHPLVLDYGTSVVTHPADVWWQGLVVLALLGVTIWALIRKPALGCLGAWFFMILAPSSSVVPLVGQTMAEHRMYLPLAAVVVVVVIGLVRGFGVKALWALAVIALLFGGLTAARNRDYADPLTLWSQTVANYPTSARAQTNLGLELGRHGRPVEAQACFARAVETNPGHVPAHYGWGLSLLAQGRAAEAVDRLRAAVALAPNHADAQLALGNSLMRVGAVADAVTHYQAALAIIPAADAHYNLGVAWVELGRDREAEIQFTQALTMEADLPEAHYQLGRLAERGGQVSEATRHYDETLRLARDHAGAHQRLGLMAAREGDYARAAAHFEALVRVDPQDGAALANLGNAFLAQNRPREAIDCYEKALRLRPGDARSLQNLELAREALGAP